MSAKHQIDAGRFNEPDFLLLRADQVKRLLRRQNPHWMWRKGHRDRSDAQIFSPADNGVQDLPVAEMKAIEVADTDDGLMRDIDIGQ